MSSYYYYYYCYRGHSDALLDSVCSICYHVLSRSNGPSPFRHKLVLSLALSHSVLEKIWLDVSSMTIKQMFGSTVNALDYLCRGATLPAHQGHALLYRLSTFAVLLYVSLSSLHDIEMFTKGPFSMAKLGEMSLKLRQVFVSLNMNSLRPSSSSPLLTTPTDGKSLVGPKAHEMQFLSNVSLLQ